MGAIIPTTPVIIGIHGMPGAGKKTLANILSMHGYTPIAIADPIKRGLAAMTGLSYEDIQSYKKRGAYLPGTNIKVTDALNSLGLEWGLGRMGEDFWLAQLNNRVMQVISNGQRVVVSDIRLNSEAQYIKEMGGSIWRINRDESTHKRTHIKTCGAVTASMIDKEIDNNSSIEDMARNVLFHLDPGKYISNSYSIDDFRRICMADPDCHSATDGIDDLSETLMSTYPQEFARRIGRLAALVLHYHDNGNDIKLSENEILHVTCADSRCVQTNGPAVENCIALLMLCQMFMDSLEDSSRSVVSTWAKDLLSSDIERLPQENTMVA